MNIEPPPPAAAAAAPAAAAPRRPPPRANNNNARGAPHQPPRQQKADDEEEDYFGDDLDLDLADFEMADQLAREASAAAALGPMICSCCFSITTHSAATRRRHGASGSHLSARSPQVSPILALPCFSLARARSFLRPLRKPRKVQLKNWLTLAPPAALASAPFIPLASTHSACRSLAPSRL